MNKNLSFSLVQHEIIIGVLLGDAHLEKQKGGINYRLKFHQNDRHKDYIFHLYDIFHDWVKTPPKHKIVKSFEKEF